MEVLDVVAVGVLERAEAFSQAVPPRIIAEYVKCETTNEEAIATEREKFKQFIIDELERDPELFWNQRDAWDVYTWDWVEWAGRGDYSLKQQESPDRLFWKEGWEESGNSQVRPDNIDPETGGQL